MEARVKKVLTRSAGICYFMHRFLAKVAQLVEPQIVDLVVAGSCPVFRPNFSLRVSARRLFYAVGEES